MKMKRINKEKNETTTNKHLSLGTFLFFAVLNDNKVFDEDEE